MRILYFPVETLTREIDSLTHLSKVLFRSGKVDLIILGNKHLLSILIKLNLLPKGVWHIKSAQSFTKPFLKKLKDRGFLITLQNAESLATFDSKNKTDLYEIPLDTVSFIDLIFCANRQEFFKIKDFHEPKIIDKLCLTGFIRSALSRRECQEYYRNEINQIAEKYPVYILYNSSAGLKYHYNLKDMFQLLVSQGVSVEHAHELMSWSDQLQATLYAFLEFVRIFSNKYNNEEIRIVYRPHPSEDVDFIKKIFSGNDMVIINSNHSVLPWILGSTITIASTSTTLIESASLGVPTVSFVPEINSNIMDLLYRNDSNLCGMLAKTPEELLRVVENHINRSSLVKYNHKKADELVGKEFDTMNLVTRKINILLDRVQNKKNNDQVFSFLFPVFVWIANIIFSIYSKFSRKRKMYSYAIKKFKKIDDQLFNKTQELLSSKSSNDIKVSLYSKQIMLFKLKGD